MITSIVTLWSTRFGTAFVTTIVVVVAVPSFVTVVIQPPSGEADDIRR
jgi:hypothetical protein